ncbi:PP2C family serine/threonine-protein phosphatase [Chryseobacterium sp. MIQD13]|uniref:PP2C family serine/threonine-protein phosphatase n=1 Tax=Chryseobacterium sp. MIQD13 TaxID=3422310 RepID=UPI003D2DEC4E
MEKAVIHREKEEFKDVHLVLKNASSKQFYEFSFDMEDFPNIRLKNITNLRETGLTFENNRISGIPGINSLHELDIEFYHTHDENNTETKKVHLLVNADPKDLWKNIPSDTNDAYHKPDDTSHKGKFLDRKIAVVSKRGRSHAHEGKFRDDDFAVNELPGDWNIISVADGAGSAAIAREGSRLAAVSVNNFFSSEEILTKIEKNIEITYGITESSEETKSEAKENIIRLLYEGVLHVYHVLDKAATENSFTIKDLHTTLIFALAKKFDFGYIVLTFGVGDCPINLISSGFSEVKLLNRMDVGEFGGGTRFITMKEIFTDDMVSRFKINCIRDFSYLVLMTDGIYDPKFMTESRLEDTESWKAFFDDLAGNNDDRVKVDFINDSDTDQQLLTWTDFWSRGNHDDRTLAIIY